MGRKGKVSPGTQDTEGLEECAHSELWLLLNVASSVSCGTNISKEKQYLRAPARCLKWGLPLLHILISFVPPKSPLRWVFLAHVQGRKWCSDCVLPQKWESENRGTWAKLIRIPALGCILLASAQPAKHSQFSWELLSPSNQDASLPMCPPCSDKSGFRLSWSCLPQSSSNLNFLHCLPRFRNHHLVSPNTFPLPLQRAFSCPRGHCLLGNNSGLSSMPHRWHRWEESGELSPPALLLPDHCPSVAPTAVGFGPWGPTGPSLLSPLTDCNPPTPTPVLTVVFSAHQTLSAAHNHPPVIFHNAILNGFTSPSPLTTVPFLSQQMTAAPNFGENRSRQTTALLSHHQTYKLPCMALFYTSLFDVRRFWRQRKRHNCKMTDMFFPRGERNHFISGNVKTKPYTICNKYNCLFPSPE